MKNERVVRWTNQAIRVITLKTFIKWKIIARQKEWCRSCGVLPHLNSLQCASAEKVEIPRAA